MKYFTIWNWLIIILPIITILIIIFKPPVPKYVVHFYNLEIGFGNGHGSPISEKEADLYIEKAKKEYKGTIHFWKEKWNNHLAVYSYKRESETHIFGKDGYLSVIPEDMLPLVNFKLKQEKEIK